MTQAAQRVVHALPLDASCLVREEHEAAKIRRFINRQRWQSVPSWSAPFLRPLARLCWLLWCPIVVSNVARRHHRSVLSPAWRRGVVGGWLYGQLPHHQLRPVPCADATVMKVGHLGDHHWVMLWAVLGSHADRLLAHDKLALSEHIATLGVRVPELLREITKGSTVDVATLDWNRAARLFVKPRNGSGAVGAMSIERWISQWYCVNGARMVHGDQLSTHLTRLASMDALLVQEFQRPASTSRDLSSEAPIELRVTTARRPNGEPFVLSCVMKVQPPRAHASTIRTGALAVAVHPLTGVMHSGALLRQPDRQYATVPWNGAAIRGRNVPDYARAVDMVLTASQVLRGLPVIGWDVLITESGPVILEANTALTWWLMHLWHALTGTPSPLLPIVMEWIHRAEQG